ncbi:P27 family phage terminase small subunit, partial [Escherichia coli]
EEGYISGGKVNPALAEMRQISKTVHTYQTKLGLNPTDRLRFVSKDEEEDDELEMFLNERD